ncbi:glycosyltransferase [Aeromonas veronii]
MELDRVAVIMSVYKSDTVMFLRQAIDSIIGQTYIHVDIFIQVDGLVSLELELLLSNYAHNERVFVFFHKENRGLATRLNNSIDNVLKIGIYNFIARMDADDVSAPNRIATQVNFLKKNPTIDVVGSDVIEIDRDGNHVFYKKMDSSHEVILKKIIKKCPFNHPSVLFRTSLFDEGLRYKDSLMNTQDYYLWVDLIAAGKKFSNINKPLLYFRIDENFHSRRGWQKAMNEFNSRLYAFNKLKVVNVANMIHVVMLFILRLSPSFIKKVVYKYFR